MKKFTGILAVLFFAAPVQACAAPTADEVRIYNETMNNPVHHLSTYDFTGNSPLSSRFGLPPVFLDYLKAMDGVPYASYEPTPEQKQLVLASVSHLPRKIRKNLEERLVGMIFVKDFRGSGMTDGAADDRKKIYYLMVYNTLTLTDSLSEWLTFKERTCFSNAAGYEIRVEAAGSANAFDYIIAHESFHAYDYRYHATPYIEEFQKVVMDVWGERVQDATRLVDGVWKTIRTPLPEWDFPLRKRIGYFGFYPSAELKDSDAPAVYRALAATPFVSTYAAISWAEDAAELFAFYYLKREFGTEVRFVVKDPSGAETSYAPLDNPLVTNRFALMEKMFY